MGLFAKLKSITQLSGKAATQPVNHDFGEKNDLTQQEGQAIKKKNGEGASQITDNQLGKVKVYNLIILDESGSMSGVVRQTIDGCNETLQTIKLAQEQNSTQEHYASIYVFQTERNLYLLKNEPLSENYVITDKQYRPGGCTPLYDAIGKTVTELYEKIKNEKNSTALVTIITDGMENASTEYSHSIIYKLIEDCKEEGWVFTFIGANIDAKQTAQSLNIDSSLQFEQSDRGMKQMWARERIAKMQHFMDLELDERNARKMNSLSEEESRLFRIKQRKKHNENFFGHSHTTPQHIMELLDNEVFVFGSNINGDHNGGASAFAVNNFGAVMGQAEGMQGKSYAIPTVGSSLNQLHQSVGRFLEYVKTHPDKKFYVTAIGCGSAGLTPSLVAPSFEPVVTQNISNVWLPAEFWDVIDHIETDIF